MNKRINAIVIFCLALSVSTPTYAVTSTIERSEERALESQGNHLQNDEDTSELNELTTSDVLTSETLADSALSMGETQSVSLSETEGSDKKSSVESETASTGEKETKEENDFVAPVITESNQHVLGHSTKIKTRSLPRLNWNNSILPRTDFIDISSHQGVMSVANFTNLKKFGVTGVIIKLTEATSYRNPYAASQIANAKKAGLKVSVYHYSWFYNKKSAEDEADYFISFAKELGLGADTIMINDIEQEDIKGFGATANSVDFAKRLINKKATKKVLHYSSLSWFSDGTLNEAKLGGPGSVWLAQYLYNPDKNDLRHTDKAAWQWASDLVFPGDNRQFDVNIDYTGLLSNPVIVGPGPALRHNQYIKVAKPGYTTWSNFDWKKRSESDKYLNQVLLAKVKYQHSNGSTYYSLYDSDDKWHGYINANATVPASPQGPYVPFGKHVQISKKGYSLWSNFNWQKKSSSDSKYQKTYLAKGLYKHRNGDTYYSLYDGDDKWQGYINANAGQVTEKQGKALTHNEYVKVIKDDYTLWNNFSWEQRQSSKKILNKVFKSKVKYNHVNGAVYYSLYDSNDKWQGYINKNATKVTPEGPYVPFGKYVQIKSKGYSLWSNFDWKKKSSSDSKYQKTYLAKGLYKHRNGDTYYSLYDGDDKWQGYINANAGQVTEKQGKALTHNEYVKVIKDDYTLWNNFSWEQRQSSKKILNKVFKSKVKYNHVNGAVYYSLYDSNDKWQGYINKNATKLQ